MNKNQALTLRALIADYAEAREEVRVETQFHGAPSVEGMDEVRKARIALDAHIDALTKGA